MSKHRRLRCVDVPGSFATAQPQKMLPVRMRGGQGVAPLVLLLLLVTECVVSTTGKC